MLLIGGRNYRGFFESNFKVTYYPTIELYTNEIDFPLDEDLVVFMGSIELSKRYNLMFDNISSLVLNKNLNKLQNKKIIFVSSSSVYGLTAERVNFTTESPLRGKGNYALEKIGLERLLSNVTRRLVVLRPSGFFGEIGGFQPRSFLNDLSENLSSGSNKVYDIEFSGNQLRDFTHIEDLMYCITHFCGAEINGQECHNVSSTEPLRVGNLTKMISRFHKNIEFNYIQSGQQKIHSYLRNTNEVERLLKSKRNVEQFLNLSY